MKHQTLDLILKSILVLSFTTVFLNGCSKRVALSDNSSGSRSVEVRPQAVLFQGSKGAVLDWFQSQGVGVQIDDLDADENLFVVHYTSSDSPEDVSRSLQALNGVIFSEPNFVVRKQDLPPIKDTLFLLQWAFFNIGQDAPHGLQGRPGADIGMVKAWTKTTGSPDVIVAVIDTGIDYMHPELADNMWRNKKEQAGMAGVDDDGNGYTDDVYGWNFITDSRRHMYYGQLGHFDPRDDHGHGTHVSGIIGAKGNNYKGVAGINWTVKLMALKFLDSGGSGDMDDAYRAIKYAVANGADILSNSWGGGGRSRALEIAIKKAEDAGVLFVAAAGNDGRNSDYQPSYPASYENENVIAVAATDNRDLIAKFSTYGVESVDIAAPGVDIMSTVVVEEATLPAQAYRSYSGTSMATPMVSGAAALLMAHRPELRKKALEVKRILLDSADRIPMLEGKVKSGGRLNVDRALEGATRVSIAEVFTVISEAVNIRTPRYPQELVDHTWTLSHEDAVQTRLYFEELEIDAPTFDLLAIYNLDYKHIFSVESPVLVNHWTPWIEGGGVKVRFANAMVQMDVTERRDYPSPQDAFAAGATDCRPSKKIAGGVNCQISIGLEAYPNYESAGFHISKVEYRVRRGI